MKNEDIISRIESKMEEIRIENEKGLKNLNKKAHELYNDSDFKDDTGHYTRLVTPDDYSRNIGVYAWGYRGGQIALLYLQGVIDDIKREIKLEQ